MPPMYKHDENADNLSSDPPKGLVGLQNLGNTCYMNASLQVLSQCPLLTDLLLCPPPFFRGDPPKLATAYTNLLSELWSSTRPRVAVPNSVLNAIRAVHPIFRGFAQHDSPEFIRAFLNDLHEELKVTPEEDLPIEDDKSRFIHDSYPNGEAGGKLFTRSVSSPPVQKEQEAGDIKQPPAKPPPPARSPVTDIFQGKMLTSVKCLSCGQVSSRQEVFLDLSLPITGRRPASSIALAQHGPCARNISLRWPAFLQSSSPSTRASPSKSRTRRRSTNSSASWSLVGAAKPLKGAVAVGRHVFAPLARASVALFAAVIFYLLLALSWLQRCVPPQLACLPAVSVQFFSMFVSAIAFIKQSSRFSGNKNSVLVTQAKRTSNGRCLSSPQPSGQLREQSRWQPDSSSFVWSPSVQLDDCLASFFAEDELSGENQYYCSRCAKLSNGLMHSQLVRLPEVLCLHLKRFRNDSHSLSKVSSSVTFPLHHLDLSPYLHPSCSDKVMTYDLMGVICHTGGVSFGHYYSYALNRYTNSWYEFDDTLVNPVEAADVAALSSRAYVLVYRKQNDNIEPLRMQVDSLLSDLSLSPSMGNPVWIDRRWVARFTNFSDPGPVNNEDFLCSHGYFKPLLWEHRDELVFQIPMKVWNLLIERFGGGPIVRTLEMCAACASTLQALDERRQYERAEYIRIQKLPCTSKCVISSKWFRSWINFVEGHQINPPGPITNLDVLEPVPSSDSKSSPVYQFRRGSAWELIPIGCWDLLVKSYGGGPAYIGPQISSSPSTGTVEDDESDVDEEYKEEVDVGRQINSCRQSPEMHATTSSVSPKLDDRGDEEEDDDDDDRGAWNQTRPEEDGVFLLGANQSSTEQPEPMDISTPSSLSNGEEEMEDSQLSSFLFSNDEKTAEATATSPLLSSSSGYSSTPFEAAPCGRPSSQNSTSQSPVPDLHFVLPPFPLAATATAHEVGPPSSPRTPTLVEISRQSRGDQKVPLLSLTGTRADAEVIRLPNASGDCDDLHRPVDSAVVQPPPPLCGQERAFTPQPMATANGYSAVAARSANSRLSDSI